MRHYPHSVRMVGEQDKASTLFQTIQALPPNVFSIAMGLVGLAGIWQITGRLYSWSAPIGSILYLIATMVYLLLLLAFGWTFTFARKTAVANLTHPVLGPFNSLLPITGMLLALGLEPHNHQAALEIFLAFLVVTLLLGGWMLGGWIGASRNFDHLHSGYYLPTVAGGLIGSEGLARFGISWAGWMCFGIGLISWLLLGSVIFNRLFTRPSLPQGLMPTIAIEMAPPALAGNAYMTLTGGKIDVLSALFVGYTLLMIFVQFCLLPSYRKLPFVVGFWSFTFPSAAAAAYLVRWIHQAHLAGTALLVFPLLTAVTLLIGSIALRSLVTLAHGTFLSPTATS